eukprot:5932641-Prymnesium_polylepis.1
MCFVTGCNAGDERVGGRWCSCVRWPADLLDRTPAIHVCQGRGPPNKPTTTRPPRGGKRVFYTLLIPSQGLLIPPPRG